MESVHKFVIEFYLGGGQTCEKCGHTEIAKDWEEMFQAGWWWLLQFPAAKPEPKHQGWTGQT